MGFAHSRELDELISVGRADLCHQGAVNPLVVVDAGLHPHGNFEGEAKEDMSDARWRGRMELAIRVLKAFCDYSDPAAEDAERIRQLAASEQERKLPLDELACAIITRERDTPRAREYWGWLGG